MALDNDDYNMLSVRLRVLAETLRHPEDPSDSIAVHLDNVASGVVNVEDKLENIYDVLVRIAKALEGKA